MPFAFRCPHCNVGYQIRENLAGKKTKCQKCGGTMVLTPPAPETTPGGTEMYRHAIRDREFEPAVGDEELIEAISNHIARYVGDPGNVFHEIVSDLVHLDIHIVAPTPERNWHTFVTSGMSERPMRVPPGAEVSDYAELVLCLPPTWPVSEEAFRQDDEANFWPIRWLKQVARLPHEYDTWLGVGHTVPNGDPPEPFHGNTQTCCWMLIGPLWFDEGFAQLEHEDGRQINFMSIVPLYREEMELKLNKGMDALIDKLSQISPHELFDPGRKNTARKKFGIF